MEDSAFIVRDFRTGHMIHKVVKESYAPLFVVGMTPDANRLLVRTEDPFTIRLHDRQTMGLVRSFTAPFPVADCIVSPDSSRLLVRQACGVISYWDLTSGKHVWTRRANDGRMEFAPDGSRFLITFLNDSSFWEAQSGSLLCTVHGRNARAYLGPGGRTLRFAAPDGLILWPFGSRKAVR